MNANVENENVAVDDAEVVVGDVVDDARHGRLDRIAFFCHDGQASTQAR